MISNAAEGDGGEHMDGEMALLSVIGDSVGSTSFHQSTSTTFVMTNSLNHCFRPRPTKNCAWRCALCSSRALRWNTWSGFRQLAIV